MKRGIITGGTGFIGSNLARYLLGRGWDISIIQRSKSSHDYIFDIKNKIQLYSFTNYDDIKQCFEIFKPDIVFHLAGYFCSIHTQTKMEKLINSNIYFSSMILEAMKDTGIKYLINTGTHWQHYNMEIYNPVNLYAATKEAYKKIIDYYVQLHSFKVITVELYDTFGCNDKRGKLLSILPQYVNSKLRLEMTKGEQCIDLTYIDDIVRAYEIAYEQLDSQLIEHVTYCVCQGNSCPLKEIILLYEELLGEKFNIKWGIKPYRIREIMKPSYYYPILPNWKASISIREGLKKLISYQKNNKTS